MKLELLKLLEESLANNLPYDAFRAKQERIVASLKIQKGNQAGMAASQEEKCRQGKP